MKNKQAACNHSMRQQTVQLAGATAFVNCKITVSCGTTHISLIRLAIIITNLYANNSHNN